MHVLQLYIVQRPLTDELVKTSIVSERQRGHTGPFRLFRTAHFCSVRANHANGSSFCGGGVFGAFEIGGIGEPLTIFTISFQQPLTTCWIHIKLHRYLAALLE